MGYKDAVNWFSATPVGSWVARQTAARIDPWLYRKTGGRFTSTGVPTIPQLVLTCTGRKSGKQRTVQIAYLTDGEDFVVVASNFGQEHHPAWRYNLEANPDATIEVDGRTLPVRAEVLTDEEKEAMWPRLDGIVPQFKVYRKRTDRDIRIFRLRPR